MNIYVIYTIIILILSFLAKLHPLLQSSNYYLLFPVFLFFNCYIINRYFKEIKEILITNSILYFLLLLVFYAINFTVNSMGFFPNADDSFFYSQGLNLFTDKYAYSSWYDFIVYVLIKVGANDALSASAYNWSLSTIVLGLIYKFSKLINPEFNRNLLYVISLNYFFMESSIVIFRDLTGLGLLLYALILATHSQKKFIFYSFLSMQIRVLTGGLAILYYIISNTRLLITSYKGQSTVALVFLAIAYLIYSYMPLDFINYISSETGVTGSLTDISQTRIEMLSNTNGSDITSKLINFGGIAAPIVMLLNILTPLRFQEVFADIPYVFLLDNNLIRTTAFSTLNYKGILSILHIGALCFWLLPFITGIYQLLKDKRRYIAYYFIITLFIVTYISFQPRHKLHFLILLPLICSFSNLKAKQILTFGLVTNCILFFIYFFMVVITI